MIGIVCIIVGIVTFSLWMWYELNNPMDAEDEHDEAVKFREQSDKNKRRA